MKTKQERIDEVNRDDEELLKILEADVESALNQHFDPDCKECEVRVTLKRTIDSAYIRVIYKLQAAYRNAGYKAELEEKENGEYELILS